MTKEDIINQNAGLIYDIAKKFYGYPKEDLFQAGVLGLLKAYKQYDESFNAKFTSFAYNYIYGEMYLLVNNRPLKINKDILKLYKLIEQTRLSLTQNSGIVPSYDDVANFLEIDKGKIYEAVMAGQSIMSLDSEENVCLYDTIKSEEKVSVDDKILIDESLEMLSEDERNIIKSRYFEDLTQCEVARKLSMTQVMVSRYEKKGLDKMQRFLTL